MLGLGILLQIILNIPLLMSSQLSDFECIPKSNWLNRSYPVYQLKYASNNDSRLHAMIIMKNMDIKRGIKHGL